MKEFIGKYYEQQKITDVTKSKEKTLKDKEILILTLENGKLQDVSVETKYLISDEPRDATTFRDEVVKPIVSEIFSILLERQIRIVDIDYLFLKLNESINLSMKMADEKLYGISEFEKTLVAINKILVTNK